MEYRAIIPEGNNNLDQDEEFLIVDYGDNKIKIRFHNYAEIYNIPGLYEDVFYRQLKCCSPGVVCSLLADTMRGNGGEMESLRVLDFGAGNGIAGEEIKKLGAGFVVGVDIIPEARDAAERDRPGIYDYYYAMDMAKMRYEYFKELNGFNFNTLITVGSLGFGDIPPAAFINAFNLIEDNGWIVFNIKDKFISDDDSSGYKNILDILSERYFSVLNKKRYCHRLSIAGEELYYVAIAGRKLRNVNYFDLTGKLKPGAD